MSDLKLDDVAIKAMLDDPIGLVGSFLSDLTDQGATVARARVPVRRTPTWNNRSDARPPGFTAASIHTRLGNAASGRLWASVNAAADPTVYLEDPREDRVKEPFLTTALWSLEGLLLWGEVR